MQQYFGEITFYHMSWNGVVENVCQIFSSGLGLMCHKTYVQPLHGQPFPFHGISIDPAFGLNDLAYSDPSSLDVQVYLF